MGQTDAPHSRMLAALSEDRPRHGIPNPPPSILSDSKLWRNVKPRIYDASR
jgi:hypothetical protein